MECAIWGSNAELIESSGLLKTMDSPRSAGRYSITSTVEARVRALSPERKALITSWLIERRMAGDPAPKIDSDVLERILPSLRPLQFSRAKERFFIALSQRGWRPGSRFKTGGIEDGLWQDTVEYLTPWVEAADATELNRYANLFAEQGLISTDTGDKRFLTAQGFEYLEAIQTKVASSTQAFIAMWFDPSVDEAAKAIAGAIEDAGYSPNRIDQHPTIDGITDAVIAEIRRSRFVVADATCGEATDPSGKEVGNIRGGVYYEAGFAKGLDLPVFWTCRKDRMHTRHFDTQHISHVVWETPADLRKALGDKISAVLGDGPRRVERHPQDDS